MHILVKFIFAITLLWASFAYAQFNGCPPGFCNLTSSGSSPSTNYLLVDTGSAMLVDVGSKILVQ